MNEMTRRECLAGYDEGLLRTLLDGELSAAWRDTVREHAAGCRACSERLARLRLDGALVQGRMQLLSGAPAAAAAYAHDYPALPPRPPVAAILAQAKVRERTGDGWRERLAAALGRWERPAGSWRPLPLAGGAVAAALLATVAFAQPAVQSFAQGVFQSLRVQRVEPIKVDPAVLHALPVAGIGDLSKVGTYSGPAEPRLRVASVAEAAQATGLALRAPARLPGTLAGAQSVFISEAVSFTYTYDGQKLVDAAREMGVSDAALLSDLRALDGQTVKGNVPAAAVFVYGDAPAHGAGTGEGKTDGGTFAAIVQLKSPSLDVPASIDVERLRTRLLTSGAVPPALANQLLAIQDWQTTLPIPLTRGTAREVQIDGTAATLVTGEMPVPALIWQKDGVLYAMTGTLSESELIDAARSMQPVR